MYYYFSDESGLNFITYISARHASESVAGKREVMKIKNILYNSVYPVRLKNIYIAPPG